MLAQLSCELIARSHCLQETGTCRGKLSPVRSCSSAVHAATPLVKTSSVNRTTEMSCVELQNCQGTECVTSCEFNYFGSVKCVLLVW